VVKILSQAGNSLADMYDVEGSIAGIDQLVTSELPIVHEMGGTVFSERLSFGVRRLASSSAQSLNFILTATDLPRVPTRLLGVQVFCNNAARLVRMGVYANNPRTSQDFPLWVWDTVNSVSMRIEDNVVVADLDLLTPVIGATGQASFAGASGQPQSFEDITLRGTTTAFGAGTVAFTALMYLAFAQIRRPSSRGLPVPGW